MDVRRRQLMLAGLGLGVVTMVAPRLLSAHATEPFDTFGIEPGGGETDQTAMLQRAIDTAAHSDTPLFLPAGIYSTRRLTLKSGTWIEGVPGRTIFRARGGGSIIKVESADNVRLSGLITRRSAHCSWQTMYQDSRSVSAASLGAAKTGSCCNASRGTSPDAQ
jgi:polygalacturonase